MRDVIGRANEESPGRPLLVPMMCGSKRLSKGHVDLRTARAYAASQIARLPDRVRAIAPAERPYPVKVSQALSHFQELVRTRVSG